MTLNLLLAWWNLIYLVPFTLALMYLGLFVFTGITFGEADADVDTDADVGVDVDERLLWLCMSWCPELIVFGMGPIICTPISSCSSSHDMAPAEGGEHGRDVGWCGTISIS